MEQSISSQILAALKFASIAHKDQLRKDDTPVPYISHPAFVGVILSSYGFPKEVVIAGILHDIIEDTNFGYSDIAEQFGQTVADLVVEVTEDKSLPFLERKQQYREHLKTASGEACIISAADLLANRMDMLLIAEAGKDPFAAFSGGAARIFAEDEKRIATIKTRVQHRLIEELELVEHSLHAFFISRK